MSSRGNSQWVAGFIIIGLGVLLLLNNFGVTDVSIGYIIKNYWPILIIMWGIEFFTYAKKGIGEVVTGAVLVVVGFLVLGNNLDWFTINLSYVWKFFWPIIIILIGISLLRGMKPVGKNNWAIMGGFERKREQWKLEDGSYWAIMGGIELDLRAAVMEEREYTIVCNAVMGGIKITVPDDITINTEGTAILGGVELFDESSGGIISTLKGEQRFGDINNKIVINIYCRAILGGIEIKSKKPYNK